MYTIKEEREITPVTFTHLVSSTLYEKRFGPYFIQPVVAGMQPIPSLEEEPNGTPKKFKPFIAATDLIGCVNYAKVSRKVTTKNAAVLVKG
jgi:20S proteasome subunit beta 3